MSEADRAANTELSPRFAELVKAKDWDGATALYAEGAVLLPPNASTIRGKSGIRAFLAGFPPVTELTLTVDTLFGAGDIAYAIGRYHLTIAAEGSPVDSGKFLDVRERQADGSWKYVADMFSSDIPAAVPAPAPPRR